MPDKKKKKKKGNSQSTVWIVSALIGATFMITCGIAVKKMISTDETRRVRQIQMVKLVEPAPQPPKPIEEKPIETEMKEETQQEFVQEAAPQEASNEDSDDKPAGDQLGLDADGTAGSDGFGLAAKKGGRALVGSGSGGGDGSLLRKYAWYIKIIQDSIKEHLQKELDKEGGTPNDNLQAIVRIVLDEGGKITKFNIIGSSGNSKMDSAIETAMKRVTIDETPPDGMPKAIKIKVSTKG